MCYLIQSLDTRHTYIAASNDQPNRLKNHNNADPDRKRLGAKRTAGQTWIPVIIIRGFPDKKSCLSFESGWKRLVRNRKSDRLAMLNILSQKKIRYTTDPKYNRILVLLYFVDNTTFIGTKFMLNYDMRHPYFDMPNLSIEIFQEDFFIRSLPWPYFISRI